MQTPIDPKTGKPYAGGFPNMDLAPLLTFLRQGLTNMNVDRPMAPDRLMAGGSEATEGEQYMPGMTGSGQQNKAGLTTAILNLLGGAVPPTLQPRPKSSVPGFTPGQSSADASAPLPSWLQTAPSPSPVAPVGSPPSSPSSPSGFDMAAPRHSGPLGGPTMSVLGVTPSQPSNPLPSGPDPFAGITDKTALLRAIRGYAGANLTNLAQGAGRTQALNDIGTQLFRHGGSKDMAGSNALLSQALGMSP